MNETSNKKNIFIAAGLLTLILVTVATVKLAGQKQLLKKSAASSQAVLGLYPANYNFSLNEEVLYDLKVTFTNGSVSETLDYFKTEIIFSPQYLRLPDSSYVDTSSSGFTKIFRVDGPQQANASGKIIIEIGASTPGSGPNTASVITVARILFKATQATSATQDLTLGSTQIVQNQRQTIPSTLLPATYTIGGSSPTLIYTPSPSPTLLPPSLTPSPTLPPIGGVPTPTPSSLPTATPTTLPPTATSIPPVTPIPPTITPSFPTNTPIPTSTPTPLPPSPTPQPGTSNIVLTIALFGPDYTPQPKTGLVGSVMLLDGASVVSTLLDVPFLKTGQGAPTYQTTLYNVPNGTYTVRAKLAGYLSRTSTEITTAGQSASVTIALQCTTKNSCVVAGDLTDDDLVDIADFTRIVDLVRQDFCDERDKGASCPVKEGNINLDQNVDIFDFQSELNLIRENKEIHGDTRADGLEAIR